MQGLGFRVYGVGAGLSFRAYHVGLYEASKIKRDYLSCKGLQASLRSQNTTLNPKPEPYLHPKPCEWGFDLTSPSPNYNIPFPKIVDQALPSAKPFFFCRYRTETPEDVLL